MSLNDIILLTKDENTDKFEKVIERFGNLIGFLSVKVRTEYAKTDLIIFLIQLIKKLDEEEIESMDESSLVMYIVNSLKYESYKLSKKREPVTCILNDIYESKEVAYDELEFGIYLSNFLDGGIITKKQRDVLQRKYCNDCTDEKIAAELHASRQAVNRLHKSALTNLRKYLN